MISYICGNVLWRDVKSVTVDVHGVGYKIFTYSGGLDSQTEVRLFTYLAVRENALDLYGFETKKELDFFELLLTVSGIGPKSALAILSVASPTVLTQAISNGDASHLIKSSGIGKKNAEKIILELKGKVDEHISIEDTTHITDALEGLKALGYSEKDAREALKKAEGVTTSEKIRSALKQLT
jgi:holliday junction DNA helicase RuvA